MFSEFWDSCIGGSVLGGGCYLQGTTTFTIPWSPSVTCQMTQHPYLYLCCCGSLAFFPDHQSFLLILVFLLPNPVQPACAFCSGLQSSVRNWTAELLVHADIDRFPCEVCPGTPDYNEAIIGKCTFSPHGLGGGEVQTGISDYYCYMYFSPWGGGVCAKYLGDRGVRQRFLVIM